MRKIFTLVLGIAIGILVNAQWKKQTAPTTGWFTGLHFTDSLNGWGTTTNGEILHTDNAGGTWNIQFDTTTQLRSVFFVNKDTGWVVGDSGVILFTQNGGSQWQLQPLPNRTVHFRDIHYANGLAVAAGVYGSPYLTNDFGANWSQRGSKTNNDYEVFVVNGSTIWIACQQGADAWYSLNNGNSWVSKDVAAQASDNWAVYAFSLDTVWMGGALGKLFLTTDTGSHWITKTPSTPDTGYAGSTGTIEQIFFISQQIGYLLYKNGAVLKTLNGGNGWMRIDSVRTGSYFAFYAYNENFQWKAGSNGLIYSSVDASVYVKNTKIKDTPAASINVYPNPAVNIVTVEIVSPVAARQRIDVLNMLGVQVLSTDCSLKQGLNTFRISVNDLPPGFYFIRWNKQLVRISISR